MNINTNGNPSRYSNKEKIELLKYYGKTLNSNKRFDSEAAKIAASITDNKVVPKSNKETQGVIFSFLDNIDVDRLTSIFMLFGTIITATVKLYQTFRNLNENEDMTQIFESEDFQKLPEETQNNFKEEIKDTNIKRVLDDKKYQFEFENGYFMESINSNKLSDIPFSLRYHKNNTNNFDEFLESVKNFVSKANMELTEIDINRLQKHYNKY